MKDSFISLVIPVFNEEENLDELISRCLKTCRGMDYKFEIILVDDGSSDKSRGKIIEGQKNCPDEIKGCFLNRNYGQHSAIMAGFEESAGDIIVTLDADLQNPPEEIPKLVAAILEGNDVAGSVREDRQDSFFRRISSAIINKSVQKATGIYMTDYGCMLRAYRRHIIDAVLQCHERSTFIPVLTNSFARNMVEIPVKHAARAKGESKYSFFKLISLQFDLLTSMTTFPLRLLSMIGGVVSILGIGFGLFLMIMRIVYGAAWAADGIFTLFAILFIFIGGQFIALGLLGEYIGRIYNDVRGRPRYVKEKILEKEGDNNKYKIDGINS